MAQRIPLSTGACDGCFKNGIVGQTFPLISSGVFCGWRKSRYFWDHQPQMFYELKVCPTELSVLFP